MLKEKKEWHLGLGWKINPSSCSWWCDLSGTAAAVLHSYGKPALGWSWHMEKYWVEKISMRQNWNSDWTVPEAHQFWTFSIIWVFPLYVKASLKWVLLLLLFIARVGKVWPWPACSCKKILLEHSHAHSFIYCLWQLWSTEWSTSLKYLPLTF